MLNLFKPRSKKSKVEFIYDFINHPNHNWIKENSRLERSITILLNNLKDDHIQFLVKNPTYIIPCEAYLSCAIGKTNNDHIILAFPELITLLKSPSFDHGLAVLAHEFGHIFHQHTERKINTLKAQIEADHFAFTLGFGEELQEVLLDHQANSDCKVRIAYLTSYLIDKLKKV